MAITYDGGSNGGARSSSRSQGGYPSLRIENLTQEMQVARIIDVRGDQETRFGKQTVVKVALAGTTYLWYLKSNNPNLGALLNMFGPNENNWNDKDFLIGLERDTFNNRSNIVVQALPAKASRK